MDDPTFNGRADKIEEAIGVRPWHGTTSAAWQFPAKHAYGLGRFLEDNRLFENEWTSDDERRYHDLAGLAERNQAVLTATAAFLFDRFLQSQPAVGRSGLFPVTDFSTIRACLKEDWRAAMALAALSIAVVPSVPGLITANSVRDLAGSASGKANALDQMDWLITQDCIFNGAAAWPQLFFLRDTVLVPDDVDAPGERVFVRPELFYIGQGAHTIADSFAHTIRGYTNIIDPGGRGNALAVASVRGDATFPWLLGHSGVADTNAEFFWLGELGRDENAGDRLFCGDAGRTRSVHRVWAGTNASRAKRSASGSRLLALPVSGDLKTDCATCASS